MRRHSRAAPAAATRRCPPTADGMRVTARSATTITASAMPTWPSTRAASTRFCQARHVDAIEPCRTMLGALPVQRGLPPGGCGPTPTPRATRFGPGWTTASTPTAVVFDITTGLVRRPTVPDDKLHPRNRTARLAAVTAAGNPVITELESGVGNCFPGLEFDARNLDRRFFPYLDRRLQHPPSKRPRHRRRRHGGRRRAMWPCRN